MLIFEILTDYLLEYLLNIFIDKYMKEVWNLVLIRTIELKKINKGALRLKKNSGLLYYNDKEKYKNVKNFNWRFKM